MQLSSSWIVQTAMAATVTVATLNPMPANAYTTARNPARYVVKPGGAYDGVAALYAGNNFSCTGSLLSTGFHVLTAAHCLASPAVTSATFRLAGGAINIPVAQSFVHPGWNGSFSNGRDIAVLQLANLAPTAAIRYSLYRGTNELRQTSVKVGYGQTGKGRVQQKYPLGVLRAGRNTYDALGDLFSYPAPAGSLLAYDFDNGLSANDALGAFGVPNLGAGANEVKAAFGDSGGPSFIGGLIAGVTSFGLGAISTDVDQSLNFSFGELSFDTRVSAYVSWIDAIVAGAPVRQSAAPLSENGAPANRAALRTSMTSPRAVPEPGVLGALALLLLALVCKRQR